MPHQSKHVWTEPVRAFGGPCNADHSNLDPILTLLTVFPQPCTHQTLMIKRELAKDPALANENWDRWLPHHTHRITSLNRTTIRTQVPPKLQEEEREA